MKSLTLFLILSSISLYAQDRQPKALLILVDGIPADMLESTSTPNIDNLTKDGAYTRAYVGGERRSYSQTPTISAVSYTSLLTGTWVNKHNVWGNDIKNPNYNYWTIFRFLREDQPEKKLGIFSTWTDNRTKIIGDGLKPTNSIKLDYIADGYELDTTVFPHDKNADYINKIDEEVSLQASKYIRENSPDLSWVYLQYTDDMGHRYGDSDIMRVAIQKADRQIGEIYNAVRYREQYYNEDWLVVIVTDHGRDAITGTSHGGQSTRERTIWLGTNKSNFNTYFKTYNPAIVDVLPTVARHLKITIPEENRLELDGIPLMGKVPLADPYVQLKGNKLNVEWTPLEAEGEVRLLITNTNNFETTGKSDSYKTFGTYKLSKGRAEVKLPKEYSESNILKIVLQGENNAVNRWIVKE